MVASEKIESPGSPSSATAPAQPSNQAPAPSSVAVTALANERFDEILVRLRGVVEKLESGNLSLEDSLRFFEEGIGLCRRGATILDSAERKVEVLLGGSSGAVGAPMGGAGKDSTGGAPRTAPFDVPAGDDD